MTIRTFNLPDLGEGLTEAEIVRWLVGVGDVIENDQPVVEVETAKAAVEVPMPYAGVVKELYGAERTVVLVGAPLISVQVGAIEPDEDTSGPLQNPEAQRYVEEERAGSGNVLVGYGTPAASGRRRRGRAGTGSNTETQHPDTVGVTADVVLSSDPGDTRPRVVSPVVRQLARDNGVDLSLVHGSGPGGLITRKDVEQSSASATDGELSIPSAHAAETLSDARAIRQRTPIKGVRKVIAERLSQSRREIPEATTWVDVDATALLTLRQEIAQSTGEKAPGVLAFLARYVTAGLARFPAMNATIDVANQEIIEFSGVGLGIAAQTERGLMVPVVQDAHRLSMRNLDAEIRRLTGLARTGSLSTSDLRGGTFTVNNYGSFGVDGSAAIINFPEAAILGIGRTLARPWVVDGEIQPRQIMQLSLVFDHRVTDGGTSAGFLRFVADCIERPTIALTDL